MSDKLEDKKLKFNHKMDMYRNKEMILRLWEILDFYFVNDQKVDLNQKCKIKKVLRDNSRGS